ncbi:hypothetical protein N474_05255 [Pseudoalteromonas luteoviolacea CPMOR-2]|uniref:Lantibiotic n=1 Tax=Pseudoalteromonas luteoviolacea DSM 6061 TaxID=1365250 RepID=A0A166WLW9_9GAMM|nr:hypothetical protein [Pseudoalteromonas luteoviolacea]KZN37635.1 hypothetical protein N475_02165 [Pseudoalteromonas luteoviolacea DSM 6061]KZN49661.1 hypothetical protein N474_05255 [Pseudoalteromonas luteoviolacea CPMOR-2]MBE0386941.1 hypothetical protein [Pseudoalteromonas luteoviolacea DSM 6061]
MKNNDQMKPLTLEEINTIAGGDTTRVNKQDLAKEPVLIRGCCTQGCCSEPPQPF